MINLLSFRQLVDPAAELIPAILADQVETPWKRSECLALRPVEEI